VRVDLEFEVVRALQQNHGGWTEGMYDECLGGGVRESASIGSVVGIDEDLDVVVLYPSGNRWTFNPAVLTKVSGINTATSPVASSSNIINSTSSMLQPEEYIRVGSLVKISRDMNLVQRLQKGHGEWADAMALV